MTRRGRMLAAVLILALGVTAPVIYDTIKNWPQKPAPAPWELPDPQSEIASGAQRQADEDTGTRRPARGAPEQDEVYVVIDTHNNRIYLRTYDSIMYEALCSTGTGAALIDSVTGRQWKFDTPKGAFRIDSRIANPWWRKPDWAFIEEKKPIPEDERERYDPNMLGDYAIGFGDGYFVHGTLYERLLGVPVTHGCIRVGAKDLKVVYDQVRIGTYLYII